MSRDTIEVKIKADGAEKTSGAIGRVASAASGLAKSWQKLDKSLDATRKNLSDLNQKFASAAKGIGAVAGAAAAAGGAIVALAKSSAQVADDQIKASRAAGVQVEEYSKLKFAAEQAGLGANDFDKIFRKLNKTLVGAAQGDKGAAALFAKVGVSIRDADGNLRSTDEVLRDVATRFQALPDGARKSALAMELFGDRAANTVNFLNNGRAGLEGLGNQLEELGGVITTEQGVASEVFNDSLDSMGRSITNIKNQIGQIFIPELTRGAQAVTKFITSQRADILAATAAGWGQLVVFVQDVISALSGNDADVDSAWILTFRDSVISIGTAVQTTVTGVVLPALALLRATFEGIATVINGIFGTTFTAEQVATAALFIKISGAIGIALASFKALFAVLTLATPILAVFKAGLAAIAVIAGGISLPFVAIAALIAGAVAAIVVYWDEIVAAAAMAAAGISEAVSGISTFISGAWDGLVELARGAWEGLVSYVSSVAGRVVESVRAIFAGAVDVISAPFVAASNIIKSAFDGLIAPIRAVIDLASRAFTAAKNLVGLGDEGATSSPRRRAVGGAIRGPGSSTSDSIAARLSNGEFVMRASAVRKYGVDFMSRLNSMKMPGFAEGGFVGGISDALAGPALAMPVPAFAGGAAGSPVSIYLPGGDMITASMNEEQVARAARFRVSRPSRNAR